MTDEQTQQKTVFPKSGQRQWRRKERGESFREDRLPGPQPCTKDISLLLREENIHSPFSRAWVGTELTRVVWGRHHKA